MGITESTMTYDDIRERIPLLASSHVESNPYDTETYGYTKSGTVLLPRDGVGRSLEAATHDMGHMLDFFARGQAGRITQNNFGWNNKVFDNHKRLVNMAALENELRAVAYQFQILRPFDYRADEREDALDTILDGLAGNDWLRFAYKEVDARKWIAEFTKTIPLSEIYALWRGIDRMLELNYNRLNQEAA